MGEHEHRMTEGRMVPPPAAPLLVAPRPADRPQHIAPHDRGTDAGVAPCGELVVEALVAALAAVNQAKRAGGDEPFVQSLAANTQGVVESLVRAGAVAVERDGEVVHS
jgi:hypothetical protein